MSYGELEERHELTESNVDEVAGDLAEELMRVMSSGTNSPGSNSAGANGAGANGAAVDAVGTARSTGTAAVSTSPSGYGDVMQRLSLLESYVRSHDKTIRRVLQIASDFLERRRA